MSDAAGTFAKPIPREPVFCGERAVEPEWIDYNDHMNVGYYLVAFDQSLDTLFEDWFGLDAAFVAENGMGPFAIQTHMHFHSELRLGERFNVSVQLLDCDHKRYHFLALMHETKTGRLAASMENIGINVDHATRRSTPMPPKIQERFAAMLDAHKDLPWPDFVGAPLGIRRPA